MYFFFVTKISQTRTATGRFFRTLSTCHWNAIWLERGFAGCLVLWFIKTTHISLWQFEMVSSGGWQVLSSIDWFRQQEARKTLTLRQPLSVLPLPIHQIAGLGGVRWSWREKQLENPEAVFFFISLSSSAKWNSWKGIASISLHIPPWNWIFKSKWNFFNPRISLRFQQFQILKGTNSNSHITI